MDIISPHQDNEFGLVEHTPIASLYFGGMHRFEFSPIEDVQHPSIGKVGINLINGSYLVMHYPSNIFWKHVSPKQPGIFEPRINITFRLN